LKQIRNKLHFCLGNWCKTRTREKEWRAWEKSQWPVTAYAKASIFTIFACSQKLLECLWTGKNHRNVHQRFGTTMKYWERVILPLFGMSTLAIVKRKLPVASEQNSCRFESTSPEVRSIRKCSVFVMRV